MFSYQISKGKTFFSKKKAEKILKWFFHGWKNLSHGTKCTFTFPLSLSLFDERWGRCSSSEIFVWIACDDLCSTFPMRSRSNDESCVCCSPTHCGLLFPRQDDHVQRRTYWGYQIFALFTRHLAMEKRHSTTMHHKYCRKYVAFVSAGIDKIK